MTTGYNPYQAPQQPGPSMHAMEGPCWKDATAAVAYMQAARLPDRCVRCNAQGTKRLSKTLYWHEGWVYLTLLAGVLIYAILATVMRQTCVVEYSLCDEHNKRRTIGLLCGWLGFVGGFGLLIGGASIPSGAVAVFGVLLMIAGPVAAAFLARVVSARRMDKVCVWMNAGAPFVEALPEAHVGAPHLQNYGGYPQAAPGWQGQGQWQQQQGYGQQPPPYQGPNF